MKKKIEVSVKMVIYHKLGSKSEKRFHSEHELAEWLWDLGYSVPHVPNYDEFGEPIWEHEGKSDICTATTYAPFIWHGGFIGYIEYSLEAKRV